MRGLNKIKKNFLTKFNKALNKESFYVSFKMNNMKGQEKNKILFCTRHAYKILLHFTYKVLEAKFVSSCFNCPSRARPHLSLLFAKSGVSAKTFESVKPG